MVLNGDWNVKLNFVGPEMNRHARDDVLLVHKRSQLRMRWVYPGKFHEQESPSSSSAYDAFVLFNPGVGHEHLQKDWRPTLDLFLGRASMILWTAHSELDAERDADYLRNSFGVEVEYSENPFASRIRYQDPFHENHLVRPNHYVAYSIS